MLLTTFHLTRPGYPELWTSGVEHLLEHHPISVRTVIMPVYGHAIDLCIRFLQGETHRTVEGNGTLIDRRIDATHLRASPLLYLLEE
jgi:hypothetical protein